MAASVDAVLETDRRGCHLDRNMDDLIRAAGFGVDALEQRTETDVGGAVKTNSL